MARTNGFDFDPSQLNYLHGYLDGMAKSVKTTAYVGSALSYAHALMTPKLDSFIDMVATANKDSFHHVYEWSDTYGVKTTVGNPAYRLWSHTLKGNGASKVASFNFKASVRPVPVNPILTTPGPGGRSVKEGVHIFYWKAMVMEYGMQIVVTPKLAQYLAFVGSANSGTKQQDARKNSGGIVFSKGPITFTAGGGKTTGKFTNIYRFWWAQMAGEVFDREIAPTLSKDLRTDGIVGRYKNRTKSFSMNNTSGYNAGRSDAVKKLRKNQRDYIAGAAGRRIIGGREDDGE